jgi:hypothetical protein
VLNKGAFTKCKLPKKVGRDIRRRLQHVVFGRKRFMFYQNKKKGVAA